MNAHKYHYRPRQSGDARFVVIPSAEQYMDQMERLHQIGYGYQPEDVADDDSGEGLTAAQFRQHVAVFPAGQFIALDRATDTVIGLTVSMRTRFDTRKPYLKSWAATTGCG